jgi:glycosyltransferase involved in cell wall biosynthesis
VPLPRPLRQLGALLLDPLTLRAERALAAALHGIAVLTQTGAECLARRMRLPGGKVLAIPHGNACVAPAPLPEAPPLRLLYFGFIYPGKGIEDLFEALALAKSRAALDAEPVRLTLAGGTAAELAYGGRDDYPARLRSRAAALGLQSSLDWRLDLAPQDIPSLIQSHHALVLPYRESRKLGLLGQMRGTSGALSWATACGRGVIASDARAFPEEIRAGNGVSYPQGDVEALAGRIASLVREPALAHEWAARAAALARERAWPAVAARFVEWFCARRA